MKSNLRDCLDEACINQTKLAVKIWPDVSEQDAKNRLQSVCNGAKPSERVLTILKRFGIDYQSNSYSVVNQ